MNLVATAGKLVGFKQKEALIPYEGDRTEYQIYFRDNQFIDKKYPEAFPQLIFTTRTDARAFKRLLKKSTRNLQTRIIRRDWIDGFIAEEKEVW